LDSMCQGSFDKADEFRALASQGKPIPPALLQECVASYNKAGAENPKWSEWQGSMLAGFAAACLLVPSMKGVILERKGMLGKSLDYETSWVKYLIKQNATAKEASKGQAANDSTPVSDEERTKLKNEISRLKDLLLSNKTGVLTKKQVVALAQDKWTKGEGKSITAEAMFAKLRADNDTITCDSWRLHQNVLDGCGVV